MALAVLALTPIPTWAYSITVKRGDTLYEIALKNRVSVQSLMKVNGITDSTQLKTGSQLILPKESLSKYSTITHKVRNGETLSLIAMRYKLSESEIAKENNLKNADYLYVGQSLELPSTLNGSSNQRTYNIQRGDTISTIARLHNIPKKKLISLNNLKSADNIYPGQVLALWKGNPYEEVKDNEQNLGSGKGMNTHIVLRGETLTGISRAHRIPIQQLISINKLKDPNNLEAGTKLALSSIHSKRVASREISTNESSEFSNKKSRAITNNDNSANWRTYGPLEVNWSNWQSISGSYVTSSRNKNGQSFYIAINCSQRKLNSTGPNSAWKNWISPRKSFENELFKDLCKSSTS